MVKRKHKAKPREQQIIALERVKILFKEAKGIFKENPNKAHKYVERARKIAMKFKISIPSPIKKQFCKHCGHFLLQGHNCTVRLKDQKVVYYCKDCKHYMRFSYSAEIKAKRRKAHPKNEQKSLY